MLGRVRPSSSSLECLELERPPSKIIKDDSLSIYETTLMKLKQGSRHVQRSPSEDPRISPSGTEMTINVHSSPTCISPSSSECQSMATSKEQRNTNVSVVYLFSKYKSSRHALSSPDNEAMASENGGSSESDISTSSSDCQLMSSTRQQLKQGCVSSSSVFLNV